MKSCHQLKAKAVEILLEETFSCVDKIVHEAHVIIARKNAQLRNNNTSFFIYEGTIYPKCSSNIPVRSQPLHYSLLEELDQANAIKDKADFTGIKNYFTAVISQSFYGSVLDALLPGVLVTQLREKFSNEEFSAINRGTNHASTPPLWDIETVREGIVRIQSHYQDTIIHLRHLLMDKLLLQE